MKSMHAVDENVGRAHGLTPKLAYLSSCNNEYTCTRCRLFGDDFDHKQDMVRCFAAFHVHG